MILNGQTQSEKGKRRYLLATLSPSSSHDMLPGLLLHVDYSFGQVLI
jgi:hypothetical protein